MNLYLDWCSYKAAKYACEHYHYAKRMPKFKQVYIGVWEDRRFIGCVIFGLSVTPYLGERFGLSNIQCAELTRIALTTHKSTISKIVKIALSMVKAQSPGLRLIVSYADPFHGHNGAVYQAANWVYIGLSAPITSYYWRGQWRNDSSIKRHFKEYPEERTKTLSRLLPRKHKYLYPLDNKMRKQIEPLRQPYPKKCVGSIDVDASGYQPEEGGSNPTPTLHKKAVRVG